MLYMLNSDPVDKVAFLLTSSNSTLKNLEEGHTVKVFMRLSHETDPGAFPDGDSVGQGFPGCVAPDMSQMCL